MKRALIDISRAFFYLVTGITVLLALALTVSRVVAYYPHELESLLNKQFEDRGVSFTGLTTHWRYTNPIILVEQIKFPQGQADGVELEIALVESAIRWQLVARRLIADHVDLVIDLNQERQQLNFLELIDEVRSYVDYARHTDELRIMADIYLNRGERTQHWLLVVNSVNQQGRHQFHGSLTSPDEALGSLIYTADAQEEIFDLQTQQAQMSVAMDNLTADLSLLTGKKYAPELSLSGFTRWTHIDDTIQGDATLNINARKTHDFEIQLASVFRKQPSSPVVAKLIAPELMVEESVNTLDDWLLSLDVQSIKGTTQIDRIQKLAVLAEQLLKHNEDTRTTLSTIAPKGELNRLEFELDADGLYWIAETSDFHLDSHMNVPEVTLKEAVFSGTLQQYLLDVKNTPSMLFLPRIFSSPWQISETSGKVLMQVKDSQFSVYSPGLNFHNVNAVEDSDPLADESDQTIPFNPASVVDLSEFVREVAAIHAEGGLVRAIGGAPDFQTAIRLNSTNSLLPIWQTFDFIPMTVAETMRRWTDDHVRSGSVHDTKFLMLQHIDSLYPTSQRRLFVNGSFVNGEIEYLADWPRLNEVEGSFKASANDITFVVDEAMVQGSELTKGWARFPFDEESSFEIVFSTVARTEDLLTFAFATEIHEWLPMLQPEWQGGGLVDVQARLNFPYKPVDSLSTPITEPQHTIEFTLHDVALHLVDINVELNQLRGVLTWEDPHTLSGRLESGLFFDQAMEGAITSYKRESQDVVDIQFQSRASVGTAQYIAGFESFDIGVGSTEFDAQLLIFPDSNKPTELNVSSDLTGLALDLSRPMHKDFDTPRQTTLNLRMFSDQTVLDLQSDVIRASLILEEDTAAIKGGALAIGEATPLSELKPQEVSLTGTLGYWEFAFDDTDVLTIPISFDNLQIAKLSLADYEFSNVSLDGTFETDDVYAINVQSDEFVGTISKVMENPNIFIHARELHLYIEDEENNEDPLDISVMEWLKPTMVRIDDLVIESTDEPALHWGNWRFGLTPKPEGVEVNDLIGEGDGWKMTTQLPIWWDRETNRTSVAATFSGVNLGNLMTLGGYQPSIESDTFHLEANVGWAGSPLAVDTTILSGTLNADLQSGRLLNLDQGEDVLRVVSLLNFSKIVNRLTLDFQDVTQRGLHFDTFSVKSDWEDGKFSMSEPLKIDGPGIDLTWDGLGDTKSGDIEGNLEVTVQLHKGFHAAAAYLASTNPPAILGWLLGSAVISDPIRRLSTAKYQLSGTMDEPELTRVSLVESRPQDEVENSDP